MRIKKIRLENIRSYKFQEIEFPEGSVLLWGNIGSGKSSVLLAIDFALFGIQKGNLSGASLLRNGEERGSVELFFEIEDREYVIKRGLKKGKNGVSQDFGFIIKEGIKEEKTALELKQKILEILDYPKNLLTKNKALIFRYTVYTPQEEMKLILLGSKEERLDALRRVFGIDKYKRIKDNSKIIIGSIKGKKKEKMGYISDLDSKVMERVRKEEEYKTEEKELQNIIVVFEESKNNVEKKKDERNLVEEKKDLLNQLKKDLDLANLSLNHKKREFENNVSEINEFKKQEAPKIEIIFEKEKIDLMKKEIENLEGEIRRILDKIQEFKTKKILSDELKEKISKIDNCPTCLQEVKNEHKERIILEENNRVCAINTAMNNFELKKLEIEKKLNELKEKVEQERKKENDYNLQKLKFEQFREKEKEMEKLMEKNSILKKDFEKIEANNLEISKKIEDLKFIDDIYSKLKEELDDLEKEFRERELRKKEIEVKLRMIKEELVKLDEEINKKEKARANLDYLNKVQFWMENHFVNLMENMEKNVMFKVHEDFNLLFEKWFEMLVGNEALQMTLDEEFSPRIFQNGYDIEYNFLSGGEKTAGALAYRLALNQVINNLMSSIKTNDLLILDEPTDGFSSEQVDRMKLLMDDLEIGQVVIVSHEAKIESFVNKIIKFEKNEHVTSVT